jgi:hypothetical protein
MESIGRVRVKCEDGIQRRESSAGGAEISD